MSDRRGDLAAPFATIAEALDEPAGRVTFMRGLMFGTLVGAAVVGSLLRARQARRARGLPIPEVAGPALEAGDGGEARSAEGLDAAGVETDSAAGEDGAS